MGFTKLIENLFRRFLPSPFTIAVLLTIVTMVLALVFTGEGSVDSNFTSILSHWEKGIWNSGLLVFAYQMMLILVLGHVLVLSKPMERLLLGITKWANNTANAAVLVVVSTMLVSFFNWGLGLIFGAILARKVGEHAQVNNIPLNYPLIGACGYAGLMIWHGGISGSAPLKVAEEGHIPDLLNGITESSVIDQLPSSISTSLTILSGWNLGLFGVVLIAIGLLAYFLGKKSVPTAISLKPYAFNSVSRKDSLGAERLDYSKWMALFFGILLFVAFLVQYLAPLQQLNITPNMLNFFMLGLAIVLHGSFKSFLEAVQEAISDTSGILIQFPLYFGIMGIMAGSGMITSISDFFVSISNTTTLPIFTFFSAGLVNIFVPSGGGQWAIQGPLVLESALQLGVPLPKAIMALAYGDQITNMLQPFWALPLLGITKLKAKEILPYTLIFMVVGSLIFITGLLVL
ncbi:short-chain fatty acid transporter [Flagellimonas sp.]|uniref:short-chain fatty acid transporter n=1 Tax=Flagellimonas sp. TaxID=2058762 RepID=UPI003F4A6BAA